MDMEKKSAGTDEGPHSVSAHVGHSARPPHRYVGILQRMCL